MSYLRKKREQDDNRLRDSLIDSKASIDPANRGNRIRYNRNQWMAGVLTLNTEGGKIQSVGDISGTFEVDFSIHSSDQIFANVTGDVTISFVNIPENLQVGMRLYIQDSDPTITIGTTELEETTETNDFLDLVIVSSDQSTVSVQSIKKNDESEQEPTVPQNVEISDYTNTSITVSWDPPAEGSLDDLEYDVEYSTSQAETNDTPTSPITNHATKDLTENSVRITGLSTATTYYVWVRAKNNAGESVYSGPVSVTTDATYNPGNVGFSAPTETIEFDQITFNWTQPVGKRLKFTLKRNLGSSVTETVVDDDVPAEGETNSYVDKNLEPETSYNYIFEVRNEFGNLINTITQTATTKAIPIPTFTVAIVDGAKIRYTVTFTPRYLQSSGTSAKFIIGNTEGEYSDDQNITTGSVPAPSRPNVSFLSTRLISDQRGEGTLRIRAVFNNDESVGESIVITYRNETLNQDTYFPFAVLDRENPPDDNIQDEEHRITVYRQGGLTTGTEYRFVARAINEAGDSPTTTTTLTMASATPPPPPDDDE